MSIPVRFAILIMALAQALDSKPPILIGSEAAKYSVQDIADMEKLVGDRPWLIDAHRTQVGGFADLYLPPATATQELRRGILVMVAEKRHIFGTMRYAQVAIQGRALDEMRGAGDANRPFMIQDGASFDDAELVSVVRFIRTKPIAPVTNSGRPEPVNGDLPIKAINRITQTRPELGYTAGQIMVILWLNDGEGTDVLMEKKGDTWIVISSMSWIA